MSPLSWVDRVHSLGRERTGGSDIFARLKWAFSASVETEGGKGYMRESLLYLYK